MNLRFFLFGTLVLANIAFAQSSKACDTETKKAKAIAEKCKKIGNGNRGYDKCAEEYNTQRNKAQQACRAATVSIAGDLQMAVEKWENLSNKNKCRTNEGKRNANCATILQQWGQELYKLEELNSTGEQSEYEELVQWCADRDNNVKKFPKCSKTSQPPKVNHEGSLPIFLDYVKYFPDGPSTPGMLFQASFILEIKGELKQALDLRLALVKRYPNHTLTPSAWLRIGEYYYNSNKWADAIKAYEKITGSGGATVATKKEASYAIYHLAESYYNQADYEVAVQKFWEYIDGADRGIYLKDLRAEAMDYMATAFSDLDDGVKLAEKFMKSKNVSYKDSLYRRILQKNKDHGRVIAQPPVANRKSGDVQPVLTAVQTVAVLPSDGVLSKDELEFFTDKAQEIALNVLPKSNFAVFPQEVVIKRLGGADNYMKECKESSCIVDLGRKASVDYVAQCRFGKLGSDLRVTFELYNVRTSGLIDKFSESVKNRNGLLAIMEKRIPDGFKKIPGASPEAKTAPSPVDDEYTNDVKKFFENAKQEVEDMKNFEWLFNKYRKPLGDCEPFQAALRTLKYPYGTIDLLMNWMHEENVDPYELVKSSPAEWKKYLRQIEEAYIESRKPDASSKAKTALPSVDGKVSGGMFTDSRDGKKYKTVKIGRQTWMAENLNYITKGGKCFGEGGKVVQTVFEPTETSSKAEVQANCTKYGRLYNWETAKKICPSGWHLPSRSEYEVLDKAVGGKETVGKKLKAKSGWYKNGNGTDEFGFSALPGGYGRSDGYFLNVGIDGYWWSASENGSRNAYSRNMDDDDADWYNDDKDLLFSVRCLQD